MLFPLLIEQGVLTTSIYKYIPFRTFLLLFTSIHKWGKTSLSMNLKKYNSGNLYFSLEENPLSMWDLPQATDHLK